MLYDTATRLQQTDFSQPEASATINQLKQVLQFFDEHANSEDRFILPHIQKHNAQLIDELEKEHETDHYLTHTLFDHIQAWENTTSADEREAIGQHICYAFSEFIAFNLYHMNKEENVLLDWLWKHCTDMEIRQMQGQIIQSISPQALLTQSRWMMRSINNKEVITWLSGVKQGAPTEVFNNFLSLAQEELPTERLTKVQTALELV